MLLGKEEWNSLQTTYNSQQSLSKYTASSFLSHAYRLLLRRPEMLAHKNGMMYCSTVVLYNVPYLCIVCSNMTVSLTGINLFTNHCAMRAHHDFYVCEKLQLSLDRLLTENMEPSASLLITTLLFN